MTTPPTNHDDSDTHESDVDGSEVEVDVRPSGDVRDDDADDLDSPDSPDTDAGDVDGDDTGDDTDDDTDIVYDFTPIGRWAPPCYSPDPPVEWPEVPPPPIITRCASPWSDTEPDWDDVVATARAEALN